METMNLADEKIARSDEPWPYAVVGVGAEGKQWASKCKLLQSKMPVYDLAQVQALDPEDIALVFVFADVKDTDVAVQWPEMERQFIRLEATVLFFVLRAGPGSAFDDPTGLVTAIPVDDALVDDYPLAVRFASEIAHMGAEVEPVCVDVSDISCIVRGASRGRLLFVQCGRVDSCTHFAIGHGLQELTTEEASCVEGALVRLVAKDLTIEDFAEGYDTIEERLGVCTRVVGVNENRELPADVLYAFLLVVGHATSDL